MQLVLLASLPCVAPLMHIKECLYDSLIPEAFKTCKFSPRREAPVNTLWRRDLKATTIGSPLFELA